MSKIRHDMQKYKPYQRWFTVREFYTMRAAVVFWIFPLLILWLASSSYQFKLRVTALKCELKTPSIQNCSCVLKPINRTLSIMNIDCFMPNPLKQMLLNIVSFRRFPSGYKQFWINQTEDFCAYQNGKPALLIDSVLKSSKHLLYNTKCPIQGYAGIRDWIFQVGHVFGPIPRGEYRVEISLVFNKTVHAVLSVFVDYFYDSMKKL